MPALAQAIEQSQRERELQVKLRAEADMASKLAIPAVPISHEDKLLLAPFQQWANERNVRHLPARSAVVATYVLEIAHRGEEVVLPFLRALEAQHNAHSLSNPVATHAVNTVLDQIIKTEPPRSWPASEKVAFSLLPVPIKNIIAKRELDRDRDLRRKQNQIAAQRHNDGAVSKPVETTKD